MGFFDFLNPKKKIQQLLSDKVMPKVLEKAKQLLREKGEQAARDELNDYASGLVKEQAAEVIPGPLQSYSDEIIDIAVGKVVDEAITKAKAEMAKAGPS
jgi:hypothetical protein